MKNLLIVLVILFGCSKKEAENIIVYQIKVRYLGSQDAPSPIIILTNRKPNENIFPEINYKIEKEDLMEIEKISYSKIKKYTRESRVLVEVNKDNKIEQYFFNKKNGVAILDKILKITSHYDNEGLNQDLLYLQIVTKKNWNGDTEIIER
jgi:hypothetical protein